MLTMNAILPDYVIELDIPVKIESSEKHRSIFQYGRAYTIRLHEHFSVLMPCEACNYPNKTYERVVVEDDETNQRFNIGVHCLVENFDITAADLDSNITPVALLLNYWHRFIVKARPDLHRFESRDAELHAMLELLPEHLGFSSPATDDALGLVRRLVEYKAYIRDYKSDIEVLQSFIGLHNDFIYEPELFADRGANLRYHPKLSREEKETARAFFEEPESTTWKRFRDLHAVMGKADRSQVPTVKIEGVLPYLYDSAERYRDHLQNYMMALCNREHRAYEVHNSARQVLNTVDLDLDNLKSELVQRQHTVYSLADERETTIVEYKIPARLVKKIEQKRYSYYFATKSRPFRQSQVRQETRSLRAMQRESQLENLDSTDRSVLEKGHFRQLAIWKPDRWHKSYALWLKYGVSSIIEGRRILESATSQLRH